MIEFEIPVIPLRCLFTDILNFILFSDILFQISAQKKSYETDFSPATQLFLKYLSSIIVDQASLADDFSLIIGQRA